MFATRRHLAGLLALILMSLPLLGAMGQDPGHDDETPLMQQMQVLKSGMKGLRRSLRDPENRAGSLATVLEMQVASQMAKTEVPVMTGSLAEAEREAFVAAYRADMVEMQKGLLDLELALLAGDDEKAAEVYQQLKDREDAGHERFTAD
jgi:hypothetical protein